MSRDRQEIVSIGESLAEVRLFEYVDTVLVVLFAALEQENEDNTQQNGTDHSEEDSGGENESEPAKWNNLQRTT